MFFSRSSALLGLGLWSLCATAAHGWKFLVIADWHGAENFVKFPVLDPNNVPSSAQTKIDVFKHIHDNYGGELVVLPGDAESGKWYKPEFKELLNVDTEEEAVAAAGELCYQSMLYVFQLAGYNELLMAMGDHELGGNPWLKGELKTGLTPNFRDIFYEKFNLDAQGNFLFNDPIGNVPSRPLGTLYANTSYAYRYNNVLFVTVDAFKQLVDDFHDKNQGKGGEGTVTCDVSGAHLTWFRNVLGEAQNDPTIKHTVVQAHLPILQPVRKIRCTGQYMDGGESSPFFQAMRDYNVDLYFGGEVHSNTATKDDSSNVLQVISRGNAANNFIIVDVTDDTLNLTQYNEIGTQARNNANYEFYGQVVVDKSGSQTTFDSTGSLKLLDRQQPMIHFPFEETFPLSERPVLAMTHDAWMTTLVQQKITILGIECWDSFPNMGEYGQQYDAHIANVVLKPGIVGKAVEMNSTSRVAVFSLGPHSGGEKVAYSLWFKTPDSNRNQILLNFGAIFAVFDRFRNLSFSLMLDKGVPALYASSSASDSKKLVATDGSINLADNQWHHMAISMPSKACLLSEVHMYVDGQRVATTVEGVDDYLFITIAGSLAVGGFGHMRANVRDQILPQHETFAGLIDEVYVWADSLSPQQVATLSQNPNGPTSPPTMMPTAGSTSPPTVMPTVGSTSPPTMMSTSVGSTSPPTMTSTSDSTPSSTSPPTTMSTSTGSTSPPTMMSTSASTPSSTSPPTMMSTSAGSTSPPTMMSTSASTPSSTSPPTTMSTSAGSTSPPTMMSTSASTVSSTSPPTTMPTTASTSPPTTMPTTASTSPPTMMPTTASTPGSTSGISFIMYSDYRCSGDSPTKFRNTNPAQCEDMCRNSESCLGYDTKLLDSGKYHCFIFEGSAPGRGWARAGSVCGIKVVPNAGVTFTVYQDYRCRGDERTKFVMTGPTACEDLCRNSASCLGYDVKLIEVGNYRCLHFQVTPPVKGWKKTDAICGIKNPS